MQTNPTTESVHRSVNAADTARLAVAVGALGVVFGDIGTSPIYTIQTVFNPSDPHPVPISEHSIYGIVSLVFWSVMIIVTYTYVTLVMRADNHGEGGIMALITLVLKFGRTQRHRTAHDPGVVGNLRGGAVLRRQHDHPCDLCAVGGRGSQSRRTPVRRLDRADHRGDHRGAVRGAAARHRDRRPVLRAGDDPVVCCDRRVRGEGHRRPAGNPEGALTDLRDRLHGRALSHRLLRVGRGGARCHRRRSAVRRHGPLRPAGDRPRLAVSRPAGVHAELFRPRRAAARR